MKKNLGESDRILRLLIAIALFIIAYMRSSWIFLAAGVFVFLEALFKWCIVYQILGKNSCPIKKK